MKKLLQNNNGFTFMEMLLVVAILGITTAAGLGIGSSSASVRQYRLDSEAKTIYLQAQNRLSTFYAAGNMQQLMPNTEKESYYSNDIPSDFYADDYDTCNLLCIKSDTTAGELFLPDSVLDSELSEGYWLVEVNLDSLLVYSVFYSADPKFSDTDLDAYRGERSNRMDQEIQVGYYSQNSTEESKLYD